ncbi:MAG: hypothetical protein M3Y74_17885 [Chloroflexota bacterium]|nr:hypothetical protein [Chloroflexota bacterium]
MMDWIHSGPSALTFVLLSTAAACNVSPVASARDASAPAPTATTMAVSANGGSAGPLTPGQRIGVTVRGLPQAYRPYCLGLASAIDRYSLPVSLGRVERDAQGTGRITAVVPPRLFPAEPAGPYLLFVGVCTSVAPDRPFVARTMIRIVPTAG